MFTKRLYCKICILGLYGLGLLEEWVGCFVFLGTVFDGGSGLIGDGWIVFAFWRNSCMHYKVIISALNKIKLIKLDKNYSFIDIT